MDRASKAKIKKVFVDEKSCLGCGMCVSLHPDVFEINKNGKSQAKTTNVSPEKIEDVIEGCPVQAIKVE